jgi:hypothetical protein
MNYVIRLLIKVLKPGKLNLDHFYSVFICPYFQVNLEFYTSCLVQIISKLPNRIKLG